MRLAADLFKHIDTTIPKPLRMIGSRSLTSSLAGSSCRDESAGNAKQATAQSARQASERDRVHKAPLVCQFWQTRVLARMADKGQNPQGRELAPRPTLDQINAICSPSPGLFGGTYSGGASGASRSVRNHQANW